MSIEIKKVYSDNPYVDEMVYYVKQLGIDTTLKLSQKANDNETLDILKKANIYIACIEGNARINMFDYFPEDAIKSCGLVQSVFNDIIFDPSTIFTKYKNDKEVQNKVLTSMTKWYIENYEEENTYYRMLNGLPPIGYPDIYIQDYMVDGLSVTIKDKYDNYIPLHKLSKSTITVLDNKGILDDLFKEDPKNREFIKHLGEKKIDIYLARKADSFDPLYIPNIGSESIREMYLEKLSNNRTYTMRAVYSEAFKYNSDYYDNIIAIFIVLITMVDIISRVQEFITRKEIFDIRSCEYLFQSYGIDFYEEIPLRYQIAMVKNIHQLLKYKSTSQCMVDICSIFGFSNIKVFKYYLLKDRNMKDGKPSFTGNLEEDFELKFIKLPLEDKVDEYIRQTSNHIDYDEITSGDPTWDGGIDHKTVKNKILEKEFNIIRTKYISIDTIYDIAKISMEMSYFFNMLYDNYEKENELNIKIPVIDTSKSFNIADVFAMLTALSYYFNNLKDIIITDQQTALHVNGFNFKADLQELSSYLSKHNHDTNGLNLFNKFQIPEDQIPSFNQMMKMFTNNLDVRNELIECMKNADTLREYSVYKKLYDSLMVIELNLDYFKDPESNLGTDPESGEIIRDFYRDSENDVTYTEYFRNEVPEFYNELMDILVIENEDDRKQRISTLIDNIVLSVENVIDMDEYQSFLYGLPAVSAEAVKQYIATVINFYKSYKTDFLGLNTIYYLDDKLDGVIQLVDDIFLFRNLTKEEKIKLYDELAGGSQTGLLAKMEYNNSIHLLETLYFDIFTWAYANYDEKNLANNNEFISMLQEKLWAIVYSCTKNDIVSINEAMGNISSYFESIDKIAVYDTTDYIKGNITTESDIKMNERFYMTYYKILGFNWLYGYEVPYTSGDECIVKESENEQYTVSELISVEYNKTYSFTWNCPGKGASIRFIGVDENNIVTESLLIVPEVGTVKSEWTPNSTLTVGLRLFISTEFYGYFEGVTGLFISDNKVVCTNRLHLAIDKDGSIFNYVGYQRNARIGVTDTSLTYNDGMDTTGFIPFKIGDVIRMNGINYNIYSPTFINQCIVFYSERFTRIGTRVKNSDIDVFNTKYNTTGDLVEFTLVENDLVDLTNARYFRLTTGTIDNTAVISINEPITDYIYKINLYKNYIPYAIDIDKFIYNNDLGYKDKCSISPLGEEVNQDDCTCTGYIPLMYGYTLQIDPAFNEKENNKINFFDINFNNLGQITGNGIGYGICENNTNYIPEVIDGNSKLTITNIHNQYIRYVRITADISKDGTITSGSDMLIKVIQERA